MSDSAAAHDHHHDKLRFDKWPADAHYGNASLAKVGMWIFLLSDALMFAGFLLGYGILRGGSDPWRVVGQPEYGINFTAALTFLLICSSVTMVLAYASCVERDRKKTTLFLALSACGGMLFLCGQYHEYFGIIAGHGLTNHGLTFGDNGYASCFYLITSFHGMHVLTGVILLWITAFRSHAGHFDDGNFDHVEVVGLFWHFVDLVWILVFTLVYLIPAEALPAT